MAEIENIRTKLGQDDAEQQLVTIAEHYGLTRARSVHLSGPAAVEYPFALIRQRSISEPPIDREICLRYCRFETGANFAVFKVTFRGKNRYR